MENNRSPRRGPGSVNAEKAKDFKSAIKRLFTELKGFQIIIFISLILAILGSILSIVAPKQLSKLTDEISNGLVINTSNLETISSQISSSLSKENMNSALPSILNISLNEETIGSILASDLSEQDKQLFQKFLLNPHDLIQTLPDIVLNKILSSSVYEGVTISKEDKVELLKGNMSESVSSVLLHDFVVDGTTISVKDQIDFLNIMSSVNKEGNATQLYQKMEEMPESIQTVLEPNMNLIVIRNIVIFLASLYICSALFTYIESILMTNVSNKFAFTLRNRISKKINQLPLNYFDNHITGDILSRVTNDVDTVAQNMNQTLATLVSAITLFLGSIFMMFITNWVMAITAILSSLFGFIFMFLVLGKSQKYFVARQTELGNLNGHIEEIYSGLNVVKVYNGKREADKTFDLYNEKVYNANRKSQFLSGLMMPMMSFIGNFGYVAVCIVGALLAMNGYITFGVIVAFISYVRLFTSPLSQIAQAMSSLQSTAAASERVFEFLDEKEMKSEENIKTTLPREKVKGEIEFKNVEFTYDGNEKPTIYNFSAKALPGEKIAIVGPTGAGKTTMVNLLMKFYEINDGDISIDGISIHDLTRENIHDLFTMVLQDTWLFNGTVKENIIYNRKNISDEDVERVCKVVGLDHFIRTLPNGYDSVLSDNDSVSAGQRQLLTIARGMLDDTPFLILDEATSNVDTRTEELVQRAMDKLTEGRTSFIIAHRLSTIKNADLILVMKDGNIIEQGNHEELMVKNGFYAELYNSQFEL